MCRDITRIHEYTQISRINLLAIRELVHIRVLVLSLWLKFVEKKAKLPERCSGDSRGKCSFPEF